MYLCTLECCFMIFIKGPARLNLNSFSACAVLCCFLRVPVFSGHRNLEVGASLHKASPSVLLSFKSLASMRCHFSSCLHLPSLCVTEHCKPHPDSKFHCPNTIISITTLRSAYTYMLHTVLLISFMYTLTKKLGLAFQSASSSLNLSTRSGHYPASLVQLS